MAEPYMTMVEIEAKYPNEWVLIAAATTASGSQEVTGGRVVLHSADRADFLRRVEEWRDDLGKLAAVQYVGVFPDENEDRLPVDSESGVA